jgi:hypothetical protein
MFFYYQVHRNQKLLLTAMFCDQKCKNEADERLHNTECAAMETLYGNVTLHSFEQCDDYRMIVAMVAILAESLQALGSVEQLRTLLEPKLEATIFDFDMNSTNKEARQKAELQLFHMLKPRREAQKKEHFKDLASSILESKSFNKFIKSEEDREFLVHYSVQSALKISLNGYDATGNETYREALGVAYFSTYFNHGCDHNVGRTFIDNKVAFVVMKPIAKDEQLFVCYDTVK